MWHWDWKRALNKDVKSELKSVVKIPRILIHLCCTCLLTAGILGWFNRNANVSVMSCKSGDKLFFSQEIQRRPGSAFSKNKDVWKIYKENKFKTQRSLLTFKAPTKVQRTPKWQMFEQVNFVSFFSSNIGSISCQIYSDLIRLAFPYVSSRGAGALRAQGAVSRAIYCVVSITIFYITLANCSRWAN